MLEIHSPARSTASTIIRGLVVFDSVALLVASALHVAGARIPLGSAEFVEPQIVPAAVVEGLAGLLFAASAYAIFAGRSWAWPMTVGAHLFAIAGFLLGLWATRFGTSPFNYGNHRVMLALFVAGLVLLLLPIGRAALGRGNSPT